MSSLNDKIRMLHDNLLVSEIKEEEKKSSIIITKSSEKDKSVLKGKVLAIGECYVGKNGEKIQSSLKVGDVVVYQKWSASEFPFGSEKYTLLKENDIVCVIKEDL
ncbi:co-chaperone GroES [Anaplasmataceae bacterium AB001_6]|nr:co-chaperone GroES [Anaplasmataceae bacterium AB001_6]